MIFFSLLECLLAVVLVAPPQKGGAAPSAKLPISGLPPAKVLPNLCVYSYRVSTASPECQALVDQGLGFYYSYVYMEAARSFETAARYDPDCALAPLPAIGCKRGYTCSETGTCVR